MKSFLQSRMVVCYTRDASHGSKLHLKDSVGAKKGSLHIQEANRRDQQSLDMIS